MAFLKPVVRHTRCQMVDVMKADIPAEPLQPSLPQPIGRGPRSVLAGPASPRAPRASRSCGSTAKVVRRVPCRRETVARGCRAPGQTRRAKQGYQGARGNRNRGPSGCVGAESEWDIGLICACGASR
jgi:hypothetical protein